MNEVNTLNEVATPKFFYLTDLFFIILFYFRLLYFYLFLKFFVAFQVIELPELSQTLQDKYSDL